jgi:hypothetical protein
MTVDPLLPPALLVVLAVVLLGGRSVAWWRYAPADRTAAAAWRGIAVSVAGLLLLAAATRPAIGAAPVTRVAGEREPNVFLVVDRSPDMTVADVDGRARTALANSDIDRLIDRYPNARFAVIGFASRPSLEWPLSADVWSLKPVMSAATTYPAMPAEGTDTGAAGTVLRYQLLGARQSYPRAKNLVFYLGAGTPPTALPQQEFNLTPGLVSGGAVLGYGDNAAGSLPAVARQIGVPYLQRTDVQALDAVLPDHRTPESAPEVAAKPVAFELYWALVAPAALLILVELYQVLRDFGRTRLSRARVRL